MVSTAHTIKTRRNGLGGTRTPGPSRARRVLCFQLLGKAGPKPLVHPKKILSYEPELSYDLPPGKVQSNFIRQTSEDIRSAGNKLEGKDFRRVTLGAAAPSAGIAHLASFLEHQRSVTARTDAPLYLLVFRKSRSLRSGHIIYRNSNIFLVHGHPFIPTHYILKNSLFVL